MAKVEARDIKQCMATTFVGSINEITPKDKEIHKGGPEIDEPRSLWRREQPPNPMHLHGCRCIQTTLTYSSNVERRKNVSSLTEYLGAISENGVL